MLSLELGTEYAQDFLWESRDKGVFSEVIPQTSIQLTLCLPTGEALKPKNKQDRQDHHHHGAHRRIEDPTPTQKDRAKKKKINYLQIVMSLYLD